MKYFPFDLFGLEPFMGNPAGSLIQALAPLSMSPPHPWGQWLYGRLINEHCRKLQGDFIECGVGQGGMSLFLGRLAQELNRKLYALDSFAGLPSPTRNDNPYFRKGDYSGETGQESLFTRFKNHIAQQGLMETIAPLQGFFTRSLPKVPREATFSFVHIDADLHGSVLECLRVLYPRLEEGGVLVVDDFFHHGQGPARAVAEYFSYIARPPLLHVSFPYSVVLVKGERPALKAHRALDGNYYSLRYLKEDKLLHGAVEKSLARAEEAKQTLAAENAKKLLQLLQNPDEASGDIYDYWRAMAAYWDDMDAISPEKRPAMKI
jgi:O-methyltransferase